MFMQKNVLNPMGMKGSFFTQPPAVSDSSLLATDTGQTVHR
jgi:CubicO group peptidase (beta-lactamase class C family)